MRGQRRFAESPKRAPKKQKFVQCNACSQGPRIGTRNLAASVSSAMFWDQNRFCFTTSRFSKGTGQYVKLRVCLEYLKPFKATFDWFEGSQLGSGNIEIKSAGHQTFSSTCPICFFPFVPVSTSIHMLPSAATQEPFRRLLRWSRKPFELPIWRRGHSVGGGPCG